MWLTAAELGVTEPQLQTRGGRMLLAAIGGVHQQPQVLLQGVQQGLDQGEVRLIGHVHQVLVPEREHI